jgi:hypothetical protein
MKPRKRGRPPKDEHVSDYEAALIHLMYRSHAPNKVENIIDAIFWELRDARDKALKEGRPPIKRFSKRTIYNLIKRYNENENYVSRLDQQ